MPLRILTIDEDPGLLAQLAAGLKAAGYLSVGASGWREGLAIHAAEPVDIIIIDLECIAAGGGDVLQQFRQVRSARPVSVIAKGWPDSRESESLADSLGVDAHLPRPVTLPALRVAIEAVLQAPRGVSSSTWYVEDVPLEPFDVEFNEPEDPDSVIFR
jgi:DNA-binding response OmpR family regulator